MVAAAVAVFVIKDGSSVLLGRRLSAVGYGTYALPGGRLEFGESFEECARREVKEETGLDIERVEAVHVANFVHTAGPTPAHFVVLMVRAVLSDPAQQPETREPDKCESWSWFPWPTAVPEPLFGPLHAFHRAGLDPLRTHLPSVDVSNPHPATRLENPHQ
ncbi:nudix hydrolase 1 [Wolffia australiana]